MIKKRIYLVRHGTTAGNLERFFQSAEEPLSPTGVEQARALAERFKDIHLDKIITSTMARAQETAGYVAQLKQMTVQESPFLVEIKRPSVLVGKTRVGEGTQFIFSQIREHELDKEWRHSDEETLYDFESRARKAFRLIEETEGHDILVVSHGFLSRMLLAVMMFDNPDEAVKFFSTFRYFALQANTAVAILEYGEIDGYTKWGMRLWNDVTHLTPEESKSAPATSD